MLFLNSALPTLLFVLIPQIPRNHFSDLSSQSKFPWYYENFNWDVEQQLLLIHLIMVLDTESPSLGLNPDSSSHIR